MCRARNRLRFTAGWIIVLLCGGCTGSTATARTTVDAGSGPAAGVKLAGFPAAAASGASGLWIANYISGTLVRVDGTTQLRETTLPIGNPRALQPGCVHDAEDLPMGSWLQRGCDLPSGVAVGAGSVWVGRNDEQAVVRLDPSTGRTIAKIAVRMHVFNIAASVSAVWVVSFQDNLIARIDPQTNAVTLRQVLFHAPSSVVIADGSVWISTSGDATVVRLDADTGAPQAAIPVGVQPLPLAAAPGVIWVRCEQDSTIVRIDPITNRVVATIPVGMSYGQEGLDNLVASPAGVWAGGLNLQWIDASSNQVARSLPIEGRPYDAGGGALWVVSLEGRISRVSPSG